MWRLTPRTLHALQKRYVQLRRQNEAQPALIAAVIARALTMGEGEFTPEMFMTVVDPLGVTTASNEQRMSPEQTCELFRGLNAYLGGTEVVSDG